MIEGSGPKYRTLGISRPEWHKLHIALWWLYITFNWQRPPRGNGRALEIFVVVE